MKLLYNSEVISWEKDLRGMICWTDKKNLEEKLMARQALICLPHSNSAIATINSEGGSHLIRHIPTRFTGITRNQSSRVFCYQNCLLEWVDLTDKLYNPVSLFFVLGESLSLHRL